MTDRAAIYCRISRDVEGQGLGVDRQEADCRALADREGLDVAAVLVDNDVSAYSGRRRPQYERLLAMVERGEVSTVLAWHPDRLHRRPVELEGFIDLVESTGARVLTVQAGEYDLATPSGRMAARIVGAVARGESEHKSARLRRKHEQLAEHGQPSGSLGFGYDADGAIVPVEAEIVRSAVAEVLAGVSVREIARRWEAGDVRPRGGGVWTPTAVRRILVADRIAGRRRHARTGLVTAETSWPAIVSVDQLDQVRRILLDPDRRKNAAATSYLLAGFVVCERCGARMVSRPNQQRTRGYVCAKGPGFTGCGGMRVMAEPLEELIVAALFAAVDDAAVAAAVAPVDDLAPLRSELVEIDGRTEALAREWADGSLDDLSWRAARKRLDGRRSELERILASVERATVDASLLDGLQARWPSLTLAQRRAALGAVLDAVVVGPARRGLNRFDPSRVVEIRWRG